MNPRIGTLWILRHPDFKGDIYLLTSKTDGAAYYLTCIQTGEEILLWQFQVDEWLYPFTGEEETHA